MCLYAEGGVVDAGTQIRVWWPLDKAWYGGEVKGYSEAGWARGELV